MRRPVSDDKPITYLGRLDNQIKVRGVRVELGEVEAVIRRVTGVDAVVCLGWPETAIGADGIVAFIGDPELPVPATKTALEGLLPVHMVPRRFELIDDMPLNASGKFDRRALLALLEESK